MTLYIIVEAFGLNVSGLLKVKVKLCDSVLLFTNTSIWEFEGLPYIYTLLGGYARQIHIFSPEIIIFIIFILHVKFHDWNSLHIDLNTIVRCIGKDFKEYHDSSCGYILKLHDDAWVLSSLPITTSVVRQYHKLL